MALSDRLIHEKDRCSSCGGSGWTWWSTDAQPPEEGKWVICRECIGTGRTDKKGRKRQKPTSPVSSG